MSHLKCPLCGRGVALSHFDPSDYDLDVYAFTVRGLGRGRGFEKTEEFSILNSDANTMGLIKDRILNLSRLFIDHDQMAEKEVLSALNIQTINPRVLAKKDKIIEDLGEEVIILKSRVNERDGRLRKKDSIIEDLSEKNVELSRSISSHAGKLRKKDKLIEDLSEKNVELSRSISSHMSKLRKKDKIIEDLTESNVNLKGEVSSLEEDLEYRIGQAKELLRIARKQKEKIEALEEQVTDLSEELI